MRSPEKNGGFLNRGVDITRWKLPRSQSLYRFAGLFFGIAVGAVAYDGDWWVILAGFVLNLVFGVLASSQERYERELAARES